MRRNRPMRDTLMTTFGTQLSPISLEQRLYVLTSDASVLMDTPLPEYKGTKTLFKKGSPIKGTLWLERAESGMKRKVIMISDPEKGRFLINAKKVEPTTQAKIDAIKAEEKILNLQNKLDEVLEDAKEEAEKVISESDNVLDKKYLGFTGKQILAATLGVIILIKVFK